MKGIILAGGSGSRMYPISQLYSKQLTLIYDKPLIYYPLSILMLGGIKDILIISNKETIYFYNILFKNGSHLGLNISYKEQKAPKGIAESFRIGKDFIGRDRVTLILGDNIFYGKLDFFKNAIDRNEGATVFGYRVTDPQRYGIVEFDENGNVLSIEEKPEYPKSDFAVPGLYVYDNQVVDIAENGIDFSLRGELEITDVNKVYLKKGQLSVEIISRGVAWLDTGTPEALLQASNYFGAIEARQGLKVACLEEIALHMKFIDMDKFAELISTMPKCEYSDYLRKIYHDRTK